MATEENKKNIISQPKNYAGEIQERQKAIVDRFKVGDLVTSFFAAGDDFYGIVISVNPEISKIMVDYNGTVIQQDPSDIRVVLWQAKDEKDFIKRGALRRKSFTASAKRRPLNKDFFK